MRTMESLGQSPTWNTTNRRDIFLEPDSGVTLNYMTKILHMDADVIYPYDHLYDG
jgi:hypothetical protein